jgi:urea transport system ATP-binding protein
MLSIEGIDLYYGASRCLRGVSLAAVKGQITCLLGRNGVGKSSLLRAVMGHEPIRGGRITWEGRDIASLATHQRARAGMGYVPQGRDIFPLLTVEENLRTGLAAAPGARAIPDDVFELFPVLKSMLGRRGGDLSGGQQQQLAIARALVARPRLLLLDEPTEGIQPSIIKQIERVIRVLASQGNIAILLVEQYYEFARGLAQRTAVMSRGEIVLAGAPGELDEAEVRRHLTV